MDSKRHNRKRFLNQYKVAKGCEECGYNAHPAALSFDHIDPMQKAHRPSSWYQLEWEEVERELKNCRVLCLNCHSVHTYNEKHYGIRKELTNAVEEGIIQE